jgi:hypothetical protein
VTGSRESARAVHKRQAEALRSFSEARQPGNTVSAIASQRQEVWYAGRPETVLGAKHRLVHQLLLASVDLDHSLTLDTLTEIFVRRENSHLLDLITKPVSSARETIVRLVLAHRPDRHPDRPNSLLRGVEL